MLCWVQLLRVRMWLLCVWLLRVCVRLLCVWWLLCEGWVGAQVCCHRCVV